MLRFLFVDAESAGPFLLLFRGSKFANRGLADDRPALHAAVVLRHRERVRACDFAERDAAVESGRFGRSNFERVEPDLGSDPPDALTTVAEREGHHAVRHAGEDPDRKLEGAARVIDTHQRGILETEHLGGLLAHERGVVPYELGQGIGKLLQPRVVREPAVVNGRGHGADLLARRILALHAWHRLEHDFRIARGLAGEVPIDPQPMHLAVSRDLVLADNRHVVLAL
ncbi:MAG: hypothetical protein DMF88_03480, partial [Acidobacteria bacterium]